MPSIIRPLLLIASMAAALAGGPLAAQRTRAPRSPAPAEPAPAPVASAPDLSRAAFIVTMDAQFRAQDPNNDSKLTRAEIEEIRGVAVSSGTVDILLEEGWIKPRGRKEVPGRPVMWGTSI